MQFLLDNWWQIALSFLVVALLVNDWIVFQSFKWQRDYSVETTRLQREALTDLIASFKDVSKDVEEATRAVSVATRAVGKMGNSIQPLTGYPAHIEASWEDVGARGRFLTDLGGMSVDMRQQQQDEFNRALNTPLITEPAAGSIADIMVDLDAWLTGQIELEALTWGEKVSRVKRTG